MTFENLNLSEPILRAVRSEGYQTPTPIQLQAIPVVLQGRDLIGCAQTGTGKTAAFALPTLQRMCGAGAAPTGGHSGPRPIRTLILSPTRELAVQIGDSFTTYGKFTGLRQTVVYGGVSQVHQVRALRAGVDTLIATPGRLIDLLGQRCLRLDRVEILILDEADRMLDMGFIEPLRRIVAQVPRERQTLMFSATMPDEIRRLTREWLREPAHIEVRPTASAADLVQQAVYHVEPRQKPVLLVDYLQNTPSMRTLVFARTKHGADKLVKLITRAGLPAAAIHGNKSQANRQRVLKQFKSSAPPVLVATDVASRGLDIDEISHVINFDMPLDPETYVHRIGRTGRAGATGVAISFCGRDERPLLNSVEKLLRRSIEVAHPRQEVRSALAAAIHAPSGQSQSGQSPKQPSSKQPDGASHDRPAHRKPGSDGSDQRRNFWKAKRRKNKPGSTAPVGGGHNSGGSGNRPKKRRKRRVTAAFQ